MDRIRENESENTAVRALVVEVTYKVSLSNAKIPKEVYEELTRMIKNTETLPEPEELAFDEEESRKMTFRWLSEHIHEDGSFQREYMVDFITK